MACDREGASLRRRCSTETRGRAACGPQPWRHCSPPPYWRGDDVRGCEVREKTDQETLFLEAWQHIDRGELRQAIGKADALLSLDQTGEKFYYTRAIAYARLAEFRSACADFSAYLKHVQLVKGPQLANAYYGCTPARGVFPSGWGTSGPAARASR